MDGIPVQIIVIEKDEITKKSTYNFKLDILHNILSKVNDLEVSVISIAGPSRQGKSFLLSYLLRYLSNANEVNWIGNNDAPLKGFKWNHGIEPETKGVWIWSEPIIVRQSVDKDMAIIIMDTQGVYDEYTDLRDWSTIVGITLLTSSYFIFNVFTEIREIDLIQLETFMNYGLLAMNRDEAIKHAFQRLLFLIRDWNHARDYNYGHTGGKKFITQKLSIKSNQSQPAQRTRELINQCFEDVTCYLMPEPGDKKDDQDFDGSLSKLSNKFISKLKELFQTLLSPDSLKPKVINGNLITGKDLFKFFEVFAEKFNGDELPQPLDLVESVAKATDLNLISKLKKAYVSEMNEKIISQDKHFLLKNEIEVFHNEIKSRIDEVFNTSKKSINYDIVKQIMQIFETELKTAFKRVNSDNEEKREKTANNTIVICANNYREIMDKFMIENNFVKGPLLDKQSNESKISAKMYFTEIFGIEEFDSNATYLLKINKSIEEIESSFKVENQKRKSYSKKINTQTIEDSLTDYCEKFKSILDEKVFLTTEKFIQCEQEIRSLVFGYFADKCCGDQDFVNKYRNLMTLRLNDKKNELEASNRMKTKEIMNKTDKELNLVLNYCNQQINKILEHFSGNEDLNQVYAFIKENAIEKFEQKSIIKEFNYLSPYKRKLGAEIDKFFVKFRNDFKAKTDDLNNFYKTTVEEAMNKCFKGAETLFKGKSLLSDEDYITFRESLIRETFKEYKDIPKYGKHDEIKAFVNGKTGSAADLRLIDRLIELYNEKMAETLLTKTFFSREDLSNVHSEKSGQLHEIFKTYNKTSNSQLLEEMITKLNHKLKTNFDEYYSKNENNREKYVEEAIHQSFRSYDECLTQKLEQVCIESDKFYKWNIELKEKAFKQLTDICGAEKELIEFYNSKLTKLIAKEENKFISENDSKLSEAKRKNSEAVNKSIEYYSDKMSKALNENMFHSKESLKRYENEVRGKSYKSFTDNCKYGEAEFISLFEFDLVNKMKLLKTKFKGDFRNKMEELESEIIDKIDDSLSQYNEVIHHCLDNLKNVDEFILKHNEVKANVINKFKHKFSLKDEEYRDLQISKLEKAINDSYNEFHDRLLNRLKKSGSFYEKFVNDSFASYAKLMKDQSNTSKSEEELENLHQNTAKNILREFINKFKNENDHSVIESNRRALDIKIMNEFQSIKKTNTMRNESNEKSDMKMIIKIQDYVNEYEERMETMNPLCVNESDLLANHLQIKNIIIEKMIASNSSLNPETLEPYLTKLELEINKSFNDFNIIFKHCLDKQILTFQNVKMNARKFYKKEMQKYYSETNFLKLDKLILFNNSVTESTIAKYQGERENMSIEEFDKAIKDSLKDIYKGFVEENNKNTPTSPSIGIDLGTTNSCVAFYQPSKPKGKIIIIPNDLGIRTTPSVVAFINNNEEIIGESAKDQAYMNSRNTIYSAKRLIGRLFSDEIVQKDMLLWPFKVVDDGNNIAKISVKVDGKDKVFFPEEISAKILKKLKQMAENHLGCEVKNAVITVPAYFNEAQKESTKDAGKIAGLNVLKIINEPTAAAIAFQLDRNDELGSRKVLIFDFGGGTLDVVVLTIESGVIDIKAIGGDNHLGGDDIDAKLIDFCLHNFSTKTHIQINTSSEEGENAMRRLTTECEKRKRQLCNMNSVTINVDHFYNSKDLRCELTRQKFEELNNELFVRSTDIVSKVLRDAELKHSDIDDVVLVGGTTRIPKIQKLLSDLFDGKRLNHSVNPDEAVAVGAAIQAAILNGELAQMDNLRVLDLIPMSLGVKIKDGLMSVVIHRNSKVPNTFKKQFVTTSDNQTEVTIEIYEGEETMAEDNRKLGTYKLLNIPPGPAGEQIIEVNFIINNEGILHVTAKIMSNGKEEEILITENKARLTNAQLQQLIYQENR